jgi:hypothetical protein
MIFLSPPVFLTRDVALSNKDFFESFDQNSPDFQIKNRQVYTKKNPLSDIYPFFFAKWRKFVTQKI